MGESRKRHIADEGVERRGPIEIIRASVYGDMKVGDSVAYDHGYQARGACKHANKRYAPKKYETGVDGAGTPRVWRIA